MVATCFISGGLTGHGVATRTYDAWGRVITIGAARGSLTPRRTRPQVSKRPHPGPLPGGEGAHGLGQRIRRSWQDDYSTDYYWNGYAVVNEYFSDDQEEQYGWAKTYVGGLAERAYSGGAYSYYFTDHLGSTEAVYNEAKARTAGIDYTAWGEILSTDGAAGGVTRRYTGHDYDPLTGDYFAPYRFYSPTSHRWLTRDPLGMVDGPNVYAYVHGNPAYYRDPLGLIDDSVRASIRANIYHVMDLLQDVLSLSRTQANAYLRQLSVYRDRMAGDLLQLNNRLAAAMKKLNELKAEKCVDLEKIRILRQRIANLQRRITESNELMDLIMSTARRITRMIIREDL